MPQESRVQPGRKSIRMLIGVMQLVTKVNTCKDQQQATERKNAEEQRQKEKKYLDKSALLKSKDEPPISNHWPCCQPLQETLLEKIVTRVYVAARENCELRPCKRKFKS